MTRRFSIITMGCKVNQYESDLLSLELSERGWERATGEPDVVVVNTCAVTGKAARQSLQEIRRAARERGGAIVAVTGCLVQFEPESVAAIPGVSLAVGNPEKPGLPDHLDRTGGGPCRLIRSEARECRRFPDPGRAVTGFRARPLLKIQDGCDRFCSYCVVPRTRGPSRSLPGPEVLARLAELHETGYGEAVLTGIHLGCWGRDLRPESSLEELVLATAGQPDTPRLRLSSLEPDEFFPSILSLCHDPAGVCPHFHLPLQSGSAEILSRMNRPYPPQAFAEAVRAIAAALPHAAVGADVMAGFPGETDAHFSETLDFLESLPLAYLHVFPYSPRPGTPAVKFPGLPDVAVVRARCKAARKLSDARRLAFYSSMEGRVLFVAPETEEEGVAAGVSENYVPVRFSPRSPVRPGEIVPVRVSRVQGNKVWGEPA
ncbi:MAG: MiaB/RimO family radical SAM methylthiotransferase [Proteobacteria bacterium]|nr:MiaB/RimO family radical SAM methylthiotransferase [Pseudomonadota bacterium]